MRQNVAPKTGVVASPSLADLFNGFLRASLSGFGGVLPWARRMVVEDRRWMTAEEFNDAFALCQFLPGANVVNFAVVFGSRMQGKRGACVALAGLLGPPLVIVTVLGALYERYGDAAALRHVLAGVAAAAAGLIIAMALKMARPLFRAFTPAPFIAMLVFVAIFWLRAPLLWVLVIGAPLSMAAAWWTARP